MTPETPSNRSESPDGCSRCRDEAVLRVVRTEIDAGVTTRQSSADSATVCQDCFARLRADPDASFNSLFEPASDDSRAARRFIKIERL
ncbi:hypothetical protein [Haladaptatus sp. DYF46]|uniref:hypothetical protein n=1 Tax=Haladaptatus sp. DYF46 TaxID=2886041 RepID=UPI001E28493C|nr:hypothetical protein [Haladaptatus sp. DYF46]